MKSIYEMNKKEFKEIERKFIFSSVGMKAKVFAILPIVLALVSLMCVLFDFGITSKDSGLIMEMIAASSFLICLAIASLTNILYYKLLNDYAVSKKK